MKVGRQREQKNKTLNVENTTISDNPMQDATFVTSEPAVSTQNSTMSDDPAPADDQAIDAAFRFCGFRKRYYRCRECYCCNSTNRYHWSCNAEY
ncbi:MAG: hypothetical protein PQ975_11420 [Methanobacterium sp.]